MEKIKRLMPQMKVSAILYEEAMRIKHAKLNDSSLNNLSEQVRMSFENNTPISVLKIDRFVKGYWKHFNS